LDPILDRAGADRASDRVANGRGRRDRDRREPLLHKTSRAATRESGIVIAPRATTAVATPKIFARSRDARRDPIARGS
jgi:hypothetical protein